MSYAHRECTRSHKSASLAARICLPYNRYICYIAVVIVSIIRELDRARGEERSGGNGRFPRHRCGRARSLGIILALQRGLRRFPMREVAVARAR
jgi:hypothetical protein